MDWTTLFLNANGRIGPKDFWIGFAILFVIDIILRYIPVLGPVLTLVLLYPWVCVYAKRLHDFGKSGWLVAIPIAALFVLGMIGAVIGGAGMIAANSSPAGVAAASAFAGLGIMALMVGLGALFWIAFALWVGLSKRDPLPNRYGPPTASIFDSVGTTPTTPTAP
jgi:uncharacterized membrane protein YhaH (DUF805 family)